MATCFHHQDRETGRACTRCGRPACPDCLIQAPVGSQCFECVRAARPKGSVRLRRSIASQTLIATYLIIAINVGLYLYLSLRDHTFSGDGPTSLRWSLVGPAINNGDYWRLVSYSVVHYGALHIALNMFILYLVGRTFEPATGPVRFTTLYAVSVLGGAAGALIASPHDFTGGASGGVFGLLAAATLVMSRRGVPFWNTGFGPLIVLNLGLNLFQPHISIGGHIGGLIAGGLTAEVMIRARKLEMPALGYLGAAAVALIAVAVAYAASG
jgi:membrane associated rhomboid family serine protease